MLMREYVEIVITLTVGCFIVAGLILCYSYVFRHMCCPMTPNKKPMNRHLNRRESISMKYLTHVSSVPTETSMV
ncbi:hypothetical protein NQ315_008679 [Exocentrus adspersus]|uniref:Uncharacterized protein n=1 Tax=Exocentrus adspersus TaxID=1586481 RepID=A0AAV8W6H5_9CUCU|nr:hypothetical protein NQ315_008679 [Exocentrus adspersus]